MLTVNRKKLVDAFAVLAPAISSRGQEVTQCVLVRCNETLKHVELIATTGGEVAICYELEDAIVHGSGSLLLPFSKVSSILKDLTTDDVQIEAADNGIELSCGRDSFAILTANPLEFPAPAEMSVEGGFEIDSQLWLRGMRRVKCGADTTLRLTKNFPACAGIEFSVADGQATLVALDGVQLASCDFACGAKVSASCVIPPAIFTALERVLDSDNTAIVRCENGLTVRCGNATLRGASLIGKFPTWRPLLTKYPVVATVKTTAGDLVRCVRQSMLFTNKETEGVWMQVRDDGAGFSLSIFGAGDGSGNCQMQIPVEVKGDATACVGSKGTALQNYLKTLDASQALEIRFAGRNSGTVFVTGDGCHYFLLSLDLEPPGVNLHGKQKRAASAA